MVRWSQALLGIFLFSTGCASAYAAPLVGTTPGIGAHVDVATRSAGAAVAAQASQYVVQPGDTLWRISQRFAMSVTDLRAKNNLDGNSVRVGQTLVVGGGMAPESAGPSAKTQAALAALKARNATSPEAEAPSKTSTLVTPATPIPVGKSAVSGSPLSGPVGKRKYQLVWPVEGVVTSRFGSRNGKGHDGVDIGAAP
ncbi:MAG TPA: LysM peptidoglycan-binding domain-containing protein, partial [Myxococcota bacterium]|nr:LysM peptidoglycan-binding domain-containing protein [Myxococcota bacterium]